MTVPAAEAAASVRLAPTTTAAVPATAAMPASETASSRRVPTPAPGGCAAGAPGGTSGRSFVEARHAGKPGSPPAEMSDRRARSEGRKAAGDKAAMPPFGPDRGEGQDRRTDEERKGGRRENDERRCRCDDDFRWRQDDDRRRRRGAEQRADRWRQDPGRRSRRDRWADGS